MKKIFLFLGLCLSAFSVFAEVRQTINTRLIIDTLPSGELDAYLKQINLNDFYQHSVDSFMTEIPATPYEMRIFGGGNNQGAHFRASYLWYRYSNGAVIRIHVREFTHMNKYSPTATWDVNLFKKEKVYRIDIYGSQNTCINGWCLE